MLETMRRREDDLLAISPPPEFQDIPILPAAPTSSSLPPPQDFRDLTPSPSCQEGRLLFSNETSEALQVFAEKVSFNILNEAMIIATLIPQAGVTVADFRSHHLSVPTGGKFSSDSYDSSSETSWEYLPEAEHLSNFLERSRTSYPLSTSISSSRVFQKRSLRKSNSEGVALKSAMEISRAAHSSSSEFSHHNQRSAAQSNTNILTKEESSGTTANTVCYTVPFECDIYSLPVDNIPNSNINGGSSTTTMPSKRFLRHCTRDKSNEQGNSRFSLREFGPVSCNSSDSQGASACARMSEAFRGNKIRNSQRQNNNLEPTEARSNNDTLTINELTGKNYNDKHGHSRSRRKRRSKSIDIENQESESSKPSQAFTKIETESTEKGKRTLGSSFFNLFRRTRPKINHMHSELICDQSRTFEALHSGRALPVPPITPDDNNQALTTQPESLGLQIGLEPRDFAARIEKVKDCGWYWGPLSSQGAEDLLRGEPDGSFIVRDSSDVHYIFSLTFKLNGLIRHVRIEHDQGNFSFGPLTRFKAATIVDFVEKAVAHSRSGRYLFFLHRRPILGPMRVQLLHPYSRFIHPRSLQHMCRFVILKNVRRDLLNSLPLPNPLLDYINTPQYYFENKRDI